MEQITTWLMSNVLGVLLLGATGSILGTILVILAKKIFSSLFPRIVAKLKKTYADVYLWAIKSAINEHLLLYFKTSPSRLNAYYASVLARIAMWMFITTWLVLGSAFCYGNDIFWLSVALLSSAFVTFSIAIRSYLCLSAAWSFDLEAQIDKSANKAIEDAVKAHLPKATEKVLSSEANKPIQPPPGVSAD